MNLPHRRSRTWTVSAATLVVALLLCPALNRVVCVQRLDQPTSRGYVPSFQRSLDIPPKPTVLSPDTQLLRFIVVTTDDDELLLHVAGWHEQTKNFPPPTIYLPTSCSLRAPPARVI